MQRHRARGVAVSEGDGGGRRRKWGRDDGSV